jgi:ABC-2 type transport system permease protein
VSPEEGQLTEKARENQNLANNYGIHPIQIQVIDKDEVKFQKAYMGLALIHGDLLERIPTIPSTDGLEYALTTAIQKMNNKISALLNLPGPIAVKLFLSASLETVAPYMGVRNLAKIPAEVEEIVNKLKPKNYGKLAFEFFNPADAADLQELARKYNIMTLSWPALSEGTIPPGQGAIGLVMEYGERSLTIPLMQVMRVPIIGTQYQLLDIEEVEDSINDGIDRLIDIHADVGYLADHGSLNLAGASPADFNPRQDQDAAGNFRTLLSQNYTLKNISLKDKDIPESLNCLIIARPTETFSEYELFQIDQFLMQGGNLALILDRFSEVLPGGQQGMGTGQEPMYIPLDTGLEKLLEHYGIRIRNAYVLDENCYRQELPAQFGGGDRPIYFAPLIKNRFINKDLEFLKNIKILVALKISPLELIADRIIANHLQVHQLFASSEKSWQIRDRISLNPLFIKPPSSSDDQQSYPLAYLVEGRFSSYFAGKTIPIREIAAAESETQNETAAQEEPPTKDELRPSDQPAETDRSKIEAGERFIAEGKSAKIFIMASAEMLKDPILDAGGRSPNATFIMNIIDYLNGREDIALLRSKEQRFNPLGDTQAATKTFVKAFNIAGLPILVVLFGLGVWLRRQARKKQIQAMFKK